jgi:hypothetical protein
MRVADIAQFAKAITFANRNHTRSSIAFLIHRDDEGMVEAGKKEGARGVASMMFDVRNLSSLPRLTAQQAKITKFPGKPPDFANLSMSTGNRIERKNSCARSGAPHPSPQGSRGERNAIDALPCCASFRQTELQGRSRQAASFFLTGQFALFDNGANHAIFNERSRCVMTERRESENTHGFLQSQG